MAKKILSLSEPLKQARTFVCACTEKVAILAWKIALSFDLKG